MPLPHAEPKSCVVNVTTGTGVDLEWKDGHRSHYSFQFLRDACPCAMCEDERGKDGRRPGDPLKAASGALPMFKPPVRAVEVEGVGRYAIRFSWNDGHVHGIYSWDYLRDVCPCGECRAAHAAAATAASQDAK